MSKTNKILVPIDFSEISVIAFNEAIEIALKLKCDLVLFYIYETNLINTIEGSFFQKSENKEIMESALKLKLQVVGKTAQARGLKVECVIKRGKVHKEIVKYADKIKPHFIIMGAHGESGYQNLSMGSNALHVVGNSKYPVLTFKGQREHKGFDELILPLDLSKETTQKVAYAVEIARAFGSTITVCSVLFRDKKDIKKRLEKQLKEVEGKIKVKGIESKSVLLEADNLPKAIVDFAEKGGTNNIAADLILIMTQQEKSLGEYLIGSFASRVLNTSKTPVLSICPKESNVVYQVSSGW